MEHRKADEYLQSINNIKTIIILKTNSMEFRILEIDTCVISTLFNRYLNRK
jgi:hypothetical protein